MKEKITGHIESRAVFIAGEELSPARSQEIVNHSPDGFAWGYGGSGPAQLALAILLELHPEGALQLYQQFKWDVIAGLPGEQSFELEISEVHDWIRRARGL